MTKIAFHFNVSDKVAYACRLLRKASKQGLRITVTGDVHDLSRLDEALWVFDPLEFLPHCSVDTSEMLKAKTPIILASNLQENSHLDVVVNLGQEVLKGFERYLRLIELVSTHEADRAQARQRWRYYNARGYPIESYEVNR